MFLLGMILLNSQIFGDFEELKNFSWIHSWLILQIIECSFQVIVLFTTPCEFDV